MASRDKGSDPQHRLELVARAQRLLGVSNEALGALAGLSRRTVTRWYAKHSPVTAISLGDLAPHVYPHDAALASEMHDIAAAFAARLHLPAPPPLPSPPEAAIPEATRALFTGAVVLAACDAMASAPRVGRAGIAAAVKKARELGLTLEDLDAGLSPPSKPRKRS